MKTVFDQNCVLHYHQLTRFTGSIGWAMILLAFGTLCGSSYARDGRPANIIFILVDDQGYYDLGCYGADEVETPNIDAMAREGVRFTDYYAAAPICSPSRAGLLTGCYPRRVGNEVWVHRPDSSYGLNPDELTIAELLQQNGYATACVGKWHLGFKEPFLPHNQGFDQYSGLLHNLDPIEVKHFDDVGGVPLIRDGTVVKRPADPAELTERYTDEAIAFMELNRDRPFFLYLSHTMLHVPLGVSESFQGSSQWGDYGDAIQELDFHVGRVFDSLRELEIDDNTVVVYASDNGRGPGRTESQKLRGNKLTTLEAGIRVPAIAWGPGLGLQAGEVCSQMVRAMDWYPTFATFAGIKVPEDRVIDGRDMSPLLRGESNVVSPPGLNLSLNASVPLRRRWEPGNEWASIIKRNQYNDAFFYHSSEGALTAVRWKHWKLNLSPTPQLFDLLSDPGESKPIRDGEILRKLRGMAVIFQEEMRLDARPVGRVKSTDANAIGRTTIDARVREQLLDGLDLTYARYGDRTLQMDLYRPNDQWGQLPAIVCIHGGGWSKGDRKIFGTTAQALASRGYVTASISYRLSGEAAFPAAIHDCKAAVRFLRSNAKEFGIDPDRIGAIGMSAGGHLAALLATSENVDELEGDGGNNEFSSAIQAAVPMGAQTDLLSPRTREVSSAPGQGEIWRQFFEGSLDENPSNYRLGSPLRHLDANDPPCWFITGGSDDVSTRAEDFRKRMSEMNIKTGMTIIDDAPHAFLNQKRWFDQMIDSADEFFKQSLRSETIDRRRE